jgi:hypothetical protein
MRRLTENGWTGPNAAPATSMAPLVPPGLFDGGVSVTDH